MQNGFALVSNYKPKYLQNALKLVSAAELHVRLDLWSEKLQSTGEMNMQGACGGFSLFSVWTASSVILSKTTIFDSF